MTIKTLGVRIDASLLLSGLRLTALTRYTIAFQHISVIYYYRIILYLGHISECKQSEHHLLSG